jgi:hypothetical protein
VAVRRTARRDSKLTGKYSVGLLTHNKLPEPADWRDSYTLLRFFDSKEQAKEEDRAMFAITLLYI